MFSVFPDKVNDLCFDVVLISILFTGGTFIWCSLWMCVYLSKLNLYYSNFNKIMKDVFLHYGEINQTVTKYYDNLSIRDIPNYVVTY